MLEEIGLITSVTSVIVYYLWLFAYGDVCENFKQFRDTDNYYDDSPIRFEEFLGGTLSGIIVAILGFIIPYAIFISFFTVLPMWIIWMIFKKATSCTKENK